MRMDKKARAYDSKIGRVDVPRANAFPSYPSPHLFFEGITMARRKIGQVVAYDHTDCGQNGNHGNGCYEQPVYVYDENPIRYACDAYDYILTEQEFEQGLADGWLSYECNCRQVTS